MKTNAEMWSRRIAAVPRGIVTATPVFAAKGENAELWDVEGRRYIDFAGGIGSLATGHRNPQVIAAVQEQLKQYTHTSFQVMGYEPYIQVAERLNAAAPFRGGAKTLLLATGAEAVENAVKIARAATGRSGVIAFSGSFHGRTVLATTLTGKVTPYKRAFGPLVSDVYHVPFPMPYRGVTVENTLQALQTLFDVQVEPSRIAAIIIEPVQGEGGFHVATPGLLRALRKLCDEHGMLLIVDEVQSGFGRTGRLFAIEHSGVEPDLVAVAKSLAGGFPLSAVIGRAPIMDFLEPGGLGSTFGGFPLACVAALAVMDVIAQQELLSRAESIGGLLRAGIARLMARHREPRIANLRGLGAMIGFDMIDPLSGRPDGAAARALTKRAFELGLIVLSCGFSGETIRILVPLTTSDAVLEEGLAVLEQALASIAGTDS